jgi:AraC-like DNA-binding protein
VVAVEEWAFSGPSAALRHHVAGYHGYRQAGLPPARHRGLPSPHLTLILTLDEPLTVARHPDADQPGGNYESLLGGLHTAPALITHEGAQSGVQVALSALGARRLLGAPAGELASLDVPADAVLGSLVEEAHDRLRAAPSWPERFAALDRLLAARLRAGREAEAPAAAVEAWRLLRRSGGRIGVRELARETGWSERHLGEVMRRETGLSPKQAARVIRFDRARRLLQARPEVRLADLAAGCGYADESHLDREFRSLAGAPPRRWLAEEFRNVQVPPAEHLTASMS